jgi:molybdate transport system regulatory protein
MHLKIRIMHEGAIILGPGRADLLDLIALTGSIAAAGRHMGMSYKRAWALVEAMNSTFTTPLVEAVKGGAGGGGASLTPTGREMLAAYRQMQAAATAASAATLNVITAALPVPPPLNKD